MLCPSKTKAPNKVLIWFGSEYIKSINGFIQENKDVGKDAV